MRRAGVPSIVLLLCALGGLPGCQLAPLAPPPIAFAVGPFDGAPTMDLRAGVLKVGVSGPMALALRRLASVEDVAWFAIRVAGADLGRREAMSRAYFDSGVNWVTFSGIRPGAVTVLVEARDLDGTECGQGSADATIAPDDTTVVTVDVYLKPTVRTPRTVGPASPMPIAPPAGAPAP